MNRPSTKQQGGPGGGKAGLEERRQVDGRGGRPTNSSPGAAGPRMGRPGNGAGRARGGDVVLALTRGFQKSPLGSFHISQIKPPARPFSKRRDPAAACPAARKRGRGRRRCPAKAPAVVERGCRKVEDWKTGADVLGVERGERGGSWREVIGAAARSVPAR